MAEPSATTKQMIEHVFDSAAPSYDRLGPSIYAQFGARLVALAPVPAGGHVLDVATGTGAALLPAARRVGPDGRVIGVDISVSMLQEAARAARAAGLNNAELRRMDAERLEFPDQAFDAVLCAFGVFFFPDMEAALGEMRRVCKPGGHIGVSVFGKSPPLFAPAMPILTEQFRAYGVGTTGVGRPVAYAPEEMEALLTQAGFGPAKMLSETSDVVYTSAEDWWAFLLSVATRATILRMDEETRARFRDEYLSRLRPLFRQDGLHLAVSVVYAVAEAQTKDAPR